MPPRSARSRRRSRAAGASLFLAGAALASSGAVLIAHAAGSRPAPVPPPVASQAPPVEVLSAPPPPPAPGAPARVLPVADPEAAPPDRVVVPGIGIDSSLVGLRRQRDGTLEVPRDFAVAGWYRDGIAPGDTGPAVLVGHVDSYTGPAVFYRLRDLRPGQRVTVHRSDDSQVDFAVYAVERVSKQAFPTDRVYGDTPDPELRLLTCGGRFDVTTKHYEDNTVVYARQVGP